MSTAKQRQMKLASQDVLFPLKLQNNLKYHFMFSVNKLTLLQRSREWMRQYIKLEIHCFSCPNLKKTHIWNLIDKSFIKFLGKLEFVFIGLYYFWSLFYKISRQISEVLSLGVKTNFCICDSWDFSGLLRDKIRNTKPLIRIKTRQFFNQWGPLVLACKVKWNF